MPRKRKEFSGNLTTYRETNIDLSAKNNSDWGIQSRPCTKKGIRRTDRQQKLILNYQWTEKHLVGRRLLHLILPLRRNRDLPEKQVKNILWVTARRERYQKITHCSTGFLLSRKEMYSNFTSPASLLRRSSVGDGETLGFMLKMSKRYL